ncbi:hypothetical protein [uncultured Oscillibacter sp.]|uniref:hypothetical protein n=1 Tax=uncultured Oscillibacter sp. TaxID=876091 RepID=UPI00262E8985|nr:hypothetical protein [uncultured Oscillibacter sp.]
MDALGNGKRMPVPDFQGCAEGFLKDEQQRGVIFRKNIAARRQIEAEDRFSRIRGSLPVRLRLFPAENDAAFTVFDCRILKNLRAELSSDMFHQMLPLSILYALQGSFVDIGKNRVGVKQ